MSKCPTCGQVEPEPPCPLCKGTGQSQSRANHPDYPNHASSISERCPNGCIGYVLINGPITSTLRPWPGYRTTRGTAL